jgi:outer membrane protein assembly factor BamB
MVIAATSLQAADWPNWMGPLRNGSSPETGLLTTWPADGPRVLWKVKGGDGYSSVAVAGGKAYTLVQRDGEEQVIALDAAKGTELWKRKIAPAYKNQYGDGPRSTPAIEGGFIYAQSVTGPLVCLKADSGDIVWERNLLKEFKAKNISWGLSASPVLDGDLVLAVPGGKGASVAAFHKKTGDVVWKSGNDQAGYASPVVATVGGQKQYIFFTGDALLAVTPDMGKELWRIPWVIEYKVNICTPLLMGDQLFVSTGEHEGCALYQLAASSAPKVVWESKGKKSVMANYWANSVAHEGHLYGLSGEFSDKIHLNCVDLKTGKLIWSRKDFGKGAITLADGHLFMTTKAGDLVLVEANPKGYQEKARVKMLGDNRTVPTIADGRMYLRDRQNILCVGVTQAK